MNLETLRGKMPASWIAVVTTPKVGLDRTLVQVYLDMRLTDYTGVGERLVDPIIRVDWEFSDKTLEELSPDQIIDLLKKQVEIDLSSGEVEGVKEIKRRDQ